MINWFLAFLGITIYFLNRYAKRKNTKIPRSFAYWIQDNWNQCLTSCLATIGLMILFLSPDAKFDFDTMLVNIPIIKGLPVKETVSLLAGLLNSALFYKILAPKK